MERGPTKSHDRMVCQVARHLKQRFYREIRAATPGFRPPEKVREAGEGPACRPDVTMIARGKEFHVLEVETADSLEDHRTHGRWRILARHAAARGGSLWVVVPAGCREAAEGRLRTLGLQARVWEV